MNEVVIWLNNPNRTFEEGVALYKKYDTSKQYLNQFLSLGNCTADHFAFKILHGQLMRIARILGNTPMTEVQTPIVARPIDIPLAKAKLKGTNENEVLPLSRDKALTNKLLTLNYNQLEPKEKAYFKNDELLFLNKKGLLITQSRLYKEVQALHEKMKVATNEDEREAIANRLIDLDNETAENWQMIDNFEDVYKLPESEKKEDNNITADFKRRQNLKTYVTKYKQKIAAGEDIEKNTARLNKALEEIDEINKKIGE